MPTSDDATFAGNTADLTPEQQAELDRTKKAKGGVAAGRALFDAYHPAAGRRRERASLVADVAAELRKGGLS
jgi:hypothetical protein